MLLHVNKKPNNDVTSQLLTWLMTHWGARPPHGTAMQLTKFKSGQKLEKKIDLLYFIDRLMFKQYRLVLYQNNGNLIFFLTKSFKLDSHTDSTLITCTVYHLS